ncbi:MAG: TolC family protein [Elusimicrobia bacterium]|nr:TolC family protein [Elusimicrobiota bacterium]
MTALSVAPSLAVEPVRPPPPSEVLSLRASLDRARKNNPRLQVAEKEYQIAETKVRQAKSLFFPRATLNFDAVRYHNETLSLIPAEIGNVVLETPASTGGRVHEDTLYIGRLNLVQTLYAGGKVDYTYRLSKANIKRAQTTLDTLQNQVELETSEAFYGLLALKEKRRLIQNALLDVEKMVRQAPNQHARLMASAERYDLRRRLSSIEGDEKDLRFKYLKALGAEYFSDIDVDGTLDGRIVEEDLQTVLVWAKQNRAELKETALQEEVDALSVGLSQAERYPVLRLGGGVEVRNDDFPLDQTNWNAVLDMNIPIFDGFSSPARVRESRYRADQGRLRRSELEDSVDLEVRAAFADLEHWKEELAARQHELGELQSAEKSYVGAKAGAPLSERLDFLRWRLNRMVEVVDAKLERALANSRLCRSMGKSVLDEKE